MSDPRQNDALAELARETRRIADEGGYEVAGARVEIGARVAAAVAGTRVFSTAELDELLAKPGPSGDRRATIEVTGETTQEATNRLVDREGEADVALLNFASATKTAGGFLKGARAQEEDLARASALYNCLATQPEYYREHRALGTVLYTDAMIYSPRVPFFRVRGNPLCERPYDASVITAAAPNAKKLLLEEPARAGEVELVFRRRTGKLLALAEHMGHQTLVLGAWGCGVFGNDSDMAADSFGTWLRIVFAVYDTAFDKPSFTAFSKRLRRGIDG
jgi:uncharacterized protein (TIGR02452 family)